MKIIDSSFTKFIFAGCATLLLAAPLCEKFIGSLIGYGYTSIISNIIFQLITLSFLAIAGIKGRSYGFNLIGIIGAWAGFTFLLVAYAMTDIVNFRFMTDYYPYALETYHTLKPFTTTCTIIATTGMTLMAVGSLLQKLPMALFIAALWINNLAIIYDDRVIAQAMTREIPVPYLLYLLLPIVILILSIIVTMLSPVRK